MGVTISMNSIDDNGGLGIDLAPAGVTPNDAGDPDAGPNNSQNFPVLTGGSAGDSGVLATLDGFPDVVYRIEFFSSPACDVSGNGEGATFLDSSDAVASLAGEATAFLSPGAVAPGQFVTTTATNLTSGDTSEFSECVQIGSSGGSPTPTPTPGPSSTATVAASPTATASPPPGGTSAVWGDNNCSDSVDPVDSPFVLRGDAGLPTNTGDCSDMGASINVLNASEHIWGDIDCNGAMTPVDSLKTLRFDAGLGLTQEQGCPGVGTGVTIAGG